MPAARVAQDRRLYANARGFSQISRRRPRALAFLDQFPEGLGVGQRLVLAYRQLAAEEEILHRVLVEDPVDFHTAVDDLEIDPVILGSIPVEFLAFTREVAEPIPVDFQQIIGGDFKLAEQFQLEEGIQLGNFRCTDFIEDDL